ncbi:multiple inositol polyphosphate phosphatase 1-like isoform X3 [Chelonus insularis]|uniref:multiple inositol polyphosphate phosphatase 1-like isoform X3 n=1 Tax=Chelonus insularis TaxID=460826 RepID=UPI00158C4441|nr:multiple inositol polyphosphate phosphatase 1-like isoform X3 [Chelonus insularis]
MYFVILLLVFFINKSWTRDVDYCYVSEDDPYLFMGSKTSYTFVGGNIRPSLSNCQPLQIWGIIRHGAYYPGIEKMTKLQTLMRLRDQIIQKHTERKDSRLCNEDLENLQSWSPDQNLKEDNANHINNQGIEDSKLLARRLQYSFPELLQPQFYDITSQNYMFRSTGSPRTQATLNSFVEGLFGDRNALRNLEFLNEPFIKSLKNCSVWLNGDDVDPNLLEERVKFTTSFEFINLIQNVSHRLGFKYNLSSEAIYMMYDMCRFDKSWAVNKISPWCAVFNKEELKVLEYSEDIDYYYRAGYGRNVNDQLGCIPLQNMFQHFKKIERGETDGQPKGIFHFTNSMTFLSLLHALEIGKDNDKLLASNYKYMSKRQWRTSFLDPLNANFIAIFYKIIFYLFIMK